MVVPTFEYSHKKCKDSIETRAKWAVLRPYVENQAILKPILLHRASKYKTVFELPFCLLM